MLSCPQNVESACVCFPLRTGRSLQYNSSTDAFYDIEVVHFFDNSFSEQRGSFTEKNRRSANLVSIDDIFQNLGRGSIHREAISFLLESFFGWGMERPLSEGPQEIQGEPLS